MPEASTKLREAKDRLDQSSYLVGYFYYRQRWYPGAIDRFKSVLKEDPQFSSRDSVYFYLAESLIKMKLQGEALPYLEKLVNEFERSEHLQEAQKRLSELKQAQTQPPAKTPGD
jgi:outer membrane protein assembly factor BamD (BamD/ComL family)